jgi:HD-like signal output (HDOD) protein
VLSALPFLHTSPEALVRKLTDLPPAPKVLHKLERLLASPEASLDQIAEVLRIEPGLSAKVVRMANSAHFGRGQPVTNINESIQRVGLSGVHELVSFAIASQLVGFSLSAYRMDAQSLWQRAVACAIAAASLAERGNVDRTDAYTAGLMHGLGLVVINRYHSKQWPARRTIGSAGYPLEFAPMEREWLNFSHAEAGAALLELWGFSTPVVTAVRFQLAPENATEHRDLCMTLATARWARSLFCVPDEKIPELPSDAWLTESGVSISDFGDWLRQVRIRISIATTELRLG